ncbi:MAG: hypothetical protein ACTSXA_04630 [Candidatus Heimdallarchaeota archaeon]
MSQIVDEEGKKLTNDNIRGVYLLLFSMSLVLLVLLFIWGLINPTSNVNTLNVIISSGVYGLTYFILVSIGLLLLLITFSLAFLIPILKFAYKKEQNQKRDFITLNEERIRPKTKNGKIKKVISDLSLILGIYLFIASQIILYAFIYL